MSPLRVVMVAAHFPPAYSGRGLQLQSLAHELHDLGAEVEVVTNAVPGAPALEEGPVLVRRVHLETRNTLWQTAEDYRAAFNYLIDEESRPDVLHVHGRPQRMSFILAGSKMFGVKTVVTATLLGSDDPAAIRRGERLGPIRTIAYRSADRFVAICPALEAAFREAGLSDNQIVHIPNGVNIKRFHPVEGSDEVARSLGWPPDAPRALFVGSVIFRKGVDVLLDAWELVIRSLPRARLYIAGPLQQQRDSDSNVDGFLREIESRVTKPPLRGRVTLLGRTEDTAPLYRAAHVFLFPSRNEGFPNVLLEALASGVPQVTARIAGSTDVSVRDGSTGFVVPQEDPEALALRTIQLLEDSEQRKEFGRTSRQIAVDTYSFERVAADHIQLYRDLLDH